MTSLLTKRARQKAATRDTIVRAARTVFLREGYRGATIRGIAKEAGYSTGAIFASFADKDALWKEVTGFQTPDEWAKDVLATIATA